MKPTLPAVQFTTGNLLIVIVGTLILGLGLYRMFPLQFNKGFWGLNAPLAIMLTIGIAILTYGKHDSDSFLKWGQATAINASKFLPMVILLCLTMGIGTVITQIHVIGIQAFLVRHPVMGPFVAALISPTSNVLIPTVQTIWNAESTLQPMCLFYLQASVMMSAPLFMLRTFGFEAGSPIMPRMYVMGLIVSLTMLISMKPLFWMTETICQYSGMIGVSLKNLLTVVRPVS